LSIGLTSLRWNGSQTVMAVREPLAQTSGPIFALPLALRREVSSG
jgi:hypothetical protein